MKKTFFATILILLVFGCNKSPKISPDILGGGTLFDPSVYKPEKYLVSVSNPHPNQAESLRPVIIACHGYSATTFEWNEFRDWSKPKNEFQLSQVLLGGHGRTYDDFKKSTWHDWQFAIADEYTKLVAAGYKNISFVASSTSCTLLLDMIYSGVFNNSNTQINVLLIDPIIIPSDKTLSLVGVLGPMLGYIEADNTTEEDKYYYHYRPQETLQQLQDVLTTVRKQLEKGITLPPFMYMKVYKSKQDPTADPVSAVLMYKGIKTSRGNPITIEMVDSKLHVFTNLAIRPEVTAKDRSNQAATFSDIEQRVIRINPL